MDMQVDHTGHLVTVWLTNGEKEAALLDPLYRHYRKAKYRVIVFRSGGGNLTENTAGLLRLNRG